MPGPCLVASCSLRPAFAHKYGSFSLAYIKDFVRDSFVEFHRILKDDGVVLFKWNSCNVPLEKILELRGDFEPIFGQNFNRIKKHETVWLCMKKDAQRRQKRLRQEGFKE